MKKLGILGFLAKFITTYRLWIVLFVVTVPLVILLVSTWKSADANTRFGVVAAMTGLMGTVVGASTTHYQTKKREIASRHFAEKREAYMEFVDLLFTMAGRGKRPSQQQLENRMLDFRKGLLVWGGSDVFKVWNLIEENPRGEASNVEALKRLDEILRRIRLDLGHDDSSLGVGELADFLLVAKDRGKLKN